MNVKLHIERLILDPGAARLSREQLQRQIGAALRQAITTGRAPGNSTDLGASIAGSVYRAIQATNPGGDRKP
jgi:hypothetical protein